MPSIPSIRTSVENQNVLILDGHAKKGKFKRDARNRLIAYSGGFSVVFPYESSDGSKWAFRCWHSDISHLKKRYETISKAISKSQLSFLCDFEYIEQGINVEGTIYPTTRMRWVDGITIKDYIWQNKDSKELLKSLAGNFVKMAQELHEQGLAHGDLQHGNILVDANHQLHLVDYDSFYCPELKGEPDIVTGLPDYQHPSRQSNKTVTEKIDYFSELIIYLSILAIAENPSLAEKYKVKDADRLLFAKEDFKDISHSLIYQDIQPLGGEFIELLNILEDYLKHSDINELKPFDTLLQANKIQFAASASKAIRNSQQIDITWSIPFDWEASIVKVGKGDPKACKNTGKITTTLEETTSYELTVKTDQGQVVKKQICIEVFDECVIDFSADKYYIFPNIPVILTWNVKYAKNVWLNDESIDSSGQKVVEPSQATMFALVAEDEFGKKDKKIEIQMLPIPQVKSLLVPAPDIASNLSLTIKSPRYKAGMKFPIINIGFITAKPSNVPSLTDLGINVELKQTCKVSSFKTIIQKLYNIIKR